MKEKALVICPGRGTYTATELGYLKRFRPRFDSFLAGVDRYRSAAGLPTISELDQATTYSSQSHSSHEHAPALIYACAMADFISINPDKIDVVAVTGNSMGWYIALAAAGALNPEHAVHLINTMGNLTGGASLGGQVIYPCVDADWRVDPQKVALIERTLAEVNAESESQAWHSIRLGGFLVLAGNDAGIRSLMKKLPPLENRYPMKLFNHSAFHTPLMNQASHQAFGQLGPELFELPRVPMVDGEGRIWQPYSTDLARLREYTLGKQVVDTYDFTLAVKTAIHEFAPTQIVLLGPGSNLGGSVGQILVDLQWKGIRSKADFSAVQEKSPLLIAMGREEQRGLAS